MVFLAKHHFLEDGVDPVVSMAKAIDQDLYRTSLDIWNAPDEDD